MPTQWESLANEHILGIAPYEPGKPIEELERELGVHNAIKLASNENPLPPSDRVPKAILAPLHRLDLEAMARAITPMTKVVFIANPNNPTATIVTADEVERFMARVPERTIVVFDEAYIEFALGPDFPDTLNYVKQGRKVAVLRT